MLQRLNVLWTIEARLYPRVCWKLHCQSHCIVPHNCLTATDCSLNNTLGRILILCFLSDFRRALMFSPWTHGVMWQDACVIVVYWVLKWFSLLVQLQLASCEFLVTCQWRKKKCSKSELRAHSGGQQRYFTNNSAKRGNYFSSNKCKTTKRKQDR